MVARNLSGTRATFFNFLGMSYKITDHFNKVRLYEDEGNETEYYKGDLSLGIERDNDNYYLVFTSKAHTTKKLPVDELEGYEWPNDDYHNLLDQLSFVYDDYTGITQGSLGWWLIADDTYTEASPFNIPANTRVVLPINPDTVIESYAPDSIPADQIWSGNKITPLNVGDSYIVRLSYTVVPDQNDRTVDQELDIAGTEDVISTRFYRLAKGAGVPNKVSNTTSLFALDTFKQNGGEFYIQSDTNLEIYDISILIHKIS